MARPRAARPPRAALAVGSKRGEEGENEVREGWEVGVGRSARDVNWHEGEGRQ